MDTKSLAIVAVGIMLLIFVSALLIRNNQYDFRQNASSNQSQNELGSNTRNRLNNLSDTPESEENRETPSEVERGQAINSEVMQLEKPEFTIDTSKDYKAVIETSQGTIKIDLFEGTAPNTVNNFVYLANEQFYSDIIFHRVMEGFMIQTGDPTGTGAGGPGYTFDDEPFEGEYTRGTLAMANSGPNTNGSQFFIMHEDTPLPKNYVIFGEVEDGMGTVDAIATSEVEAGPNGENSHPVDPAVMESVEIVIE